VLGNQEVMQFTFFIKWKLLRHPSTKDKAIAETAEVQIAGDTALI
jgi:hypothetical protein